MDLYSNIQDAMWQNGEEWGGRWTVVRQGKANRGFGRLAGGPWGDGGGAPAGFNLGDIQVNEPRQGGLARREWGEEHAGTVSSKETGASGGGGGNGSHGNTTQGSGTAICGKANGGQGAGFGIGGPGWGANRNTQDLGWRDRTMQGTLLGFFTEPRPASC